MIRFSLRCDRGHAFQSWFRDNQAFDDLASAGHLACPACGSTQVAKALMAPAIVTTRQQMAREDRPAAPALPEAAQSSPAPVADDQAASLRMALREMRDHLLRHSKDVGMQFAAEARRMHEGESEKAAIHGQASHDDVRSLLEDGIGVMPLPVLPDERN